MSTIAEQWIEQGVQQGQAALLRRQLTRRFGPLPDWAEERLTQAELAQLEAWADRVLDADTLDAVFPVGAPHRPEGEPPTGGHTALRPVGAAPPPR